MFKKLALISISSVLLTAGCGGGGDNGDGRIAVSASAGEGGTISPASQRIAKGAQATLTVQADAIYNIQSVNGCGGVLEGNTYRTGAVNADCAVTASFQLKPMVINLETLPQSVAENTNTALNIVVENAKNAPTVTLRAVGGYGQGFVTVAQAGGTAFNLTTQNVDRNAAVELEVTVQDGTNAGRSVTQRFSVVIENTSFADPLARYQVIADNASRILALTEEKLVVAAFKDVATILNLDDAASMTASNSNTYAELESQLNQNPVAEYLAGNLSDAELTAVMSNVEALMTAHVAPYIANINQLMPILAAEGMSTVSLLQWHLNTQMNTVSLFVGNAELGQVDNGEWAFNSSFEYLGSLINGDCTL